MTTESNTSRDSSTTSLNISILWNKAPSSISSRRSHKSDYSSAPPAPPAPIATPPHVRKLPSVIEIDAAPLHPEVRGDKMSSSRSSSVTSASKKSLVSSKKVVPTGSHQPSSVHSSEISRIYETIGGKQSRADQTSLPPPSHRSGTRHRETKNAHTSVKSHSRHGVDASTSYYGSGSSYYTHQHRQTPMTNMGMMSGDEMSGAPGIVRLVTPQGSHLYVKVDEKAYKSVVAEQQWVPPTISAVVTPPVSQRKSFAI